MTDKRLLKGRKHLGLSQITMVSAAASKLGNVSRFPTSVSKNKQVYNPFRKPKLRSQPGERSSSEAPHCSSYSMRLSLNYFGVLFLVASIYRFVFFSTIRLK